MPETFSIRDNTIALFLRIGPRRVNDEYIFCLQYMFKQKYSWT